MHWVSFIGKSMWVNCMKGRGTETASGVQLRFSFVSLTNLRNSHDMHENCNNLWKKKRPISTKLYYEFYNGVSAWFLGIEVN